MTPCNKRMLVGVVLVCTVGALLPASDALSLGTRFQAPSAPHWMGTDQLGRDVFTRGLRAITRSGFFALAVWAIAFPFGVAIGCVGALRESYLTGRLIEGLIAVAYALPLLLILVAVMSLMGHGLFAACAIVTLIAWVPVARHTRAIVRETLSARFVTAAREMGFSEIALIRHILAPATFRPVLAASFAILPELIAIVASLGFSALALLHRLPRLVS